MRRKRYSFTLLETMVALAIAAVIFSFLFSSFRHLHVLRKEVEVLRSAASKKHSFHLRLLSLTHQLSDGDQKTTESTEGKDEALSGSFYTTEYGPRKERALVMKCQNALDIDRRFLGENRIVLFVDTLHHRLNLMTEGAEGHRREEIFMENIQKMEVRCLDLEKKTWCEEWLPSMDLPSMLKIVLFTTDRQAMEFVFSLAHPTSFIAYTIHPGHSGHPGHSVPPGL